MKRVLGLCCVALLLASCTRRTEAAFSPEDAAIIKQQGTGIITGHAFRTRPKGQIVNAAGEVVYLIPQTAFARERIKALFGEEKYVRHINSGWPWWQLDSNAEYDEHMRQTKTESNGRFTFKNVAPGRYFVATQVSWGSEDDLFKEGGLVYDGVTLSGKETEPAHVILSGN